jgi:hypothetical protein
MIYISFFIGEMVSLKTCLYKTASSPDLAHSRHLYLGVKYHEGDRHLYKEHRMTINSLQTIQPKALLRTAICHSLVNIVRLIICTLYTVT